MMRAIIHDILAALGVIAFITIIGWVIGLYDLNVWIGEAVVIVLAVLAASLVWNRDNSTS